MSHNKTIKTTEEKVHDYKTAYKQRVKEGLEVKSFQKGGKRTAFGKLSGTPKVDY